MNRDKKLGKVYIDITESDANELMYGIVTGKRLGTFQLYQWDFCIIPSLFIVA